VLKDIFTRQDTCEVCNLKYDRENGFFLGGIPVSYALICTFWIVPWLIAYFFGWAPVLWTVLGAISGAIAFTYLGYAYCQCLWLGIYFCFAKHEMPPLDSPTKANE
jgi:predicted permease